jgi:porin
VLGGQRESAAQAGQFDLSVTIDTKKLFGWTGGTLQTSMTYREGHLLPVNLLQQAQEIYWPRRHRTARRTLIRAETV